MIHAIQRHAALLLGIALAALICVRAAPFFTNHRGDIGPTLLHSQSALLGFVVLAVCLAVGAVIAAVAGRFTNTVVGLFALGAGLFALNGRLETVRTYAFAHSGEAPRNLLLLLLVETLILGLLIFVAALLVFKISGPLKDVEPEKPYDPPHPWFGSAALKCAAAGVLMLLAVWLVARSPMKGQMMAATIIGGTLSGLVGRLAQPHVQPILLYVSPMVAGALGYAIALLTMNNGFDALYITGNLPSFAMVMPMDYAVGTLIGVSLGLGWAKSFLHHEEAPAAARA